MNEIISIEEIGTTNDFVYDIETDAGTFQAGDGFIIVKNTDSCYIQFHVDKQLYTNNEIFDETPFMKEHFRLAIECANMITKTFKKPIELEFEKIMYPFLLFGKKRYTSLIWTNPLKPDYVDYKGIQVVRRDSCQFVKKSCTNIIDAIMYDKNIPKAELVARQCIQDLFNNKVPIQDLIISKSLRNNYKVDGIPTKWDIAPVASPHVRLAQKLKKIDPMGHPKPPDRVPYVFVECKGSQKTLKAMKQFERVEHPDHLGKNKIDSLYYFDHQLQSPIDMLFELLIDDPSVLYRDERRKVLNKQKGQSEITSFFSK